MRWYSPESRGFASWPHRMPRGRFGSCYACVAKDQSWMVPASLHATVGAAYVCAFQQFQNVLANNSLDNVETV